MNNELQQAQSGAAQAKSEAAQAQNEVAQAKSEVAQAKNEAVQAKNEATHIKAQLGTQLEEANYAARVAENDCRALVTTCMLAAHWLYTSCLLIAQ